MHIRLVPNARPTVVANLPNSCGKFGIVVQSLDTNGLVFLGQDDVALAGPLDPDGNAPDGISVQKQTTVTNFPSTLILAPFVGTLYAINVGAASTVLAVFVFKLE